MRNLWTSTVVGALVLATLPVNITPVKSEPTISVASIGKAIDPQTGQEVEGFAIAYGKGTIGLQTAQAAACYTFQSGSTKWRVAEPWIINPTNSRGLDEATVVSTVSAAIDKWETAASTDILGNGTTTTDQLDTSLTTPNGVNEVSFGQVLPQWGAAMTVAWKVTSGSPSQRQIVEWDTMYDDIDFDWSFNGEADKTDFENRATHEAGYSMGLGKVTNGCTEESMYSIFNLGETKKRDLNSGDIAGINALY